MAWFKGYRWTAFFYRWLQMELWVVSSHDNGTMIDYVEGLRTPVTSTVSRNFGYHFHACLRMNHPIKRFQRHYFTGAIGYKRASFNNVVLRRQTPCATVVSGFFWRTTSTIKGQHPCSIWGTIFGNEFWIIWFQAVEGNLVLQLQHIVKNESGHREHSLKSAFFYAI